MSLTLNDMRKSKALVLDSWAIMTYLEGEPAAERIADLISDAHDESVPMLMSVVNAGEVWYIIARRTNASEADRAIRMIKDIGIKFVDSDWPLTKIAASYKVRGNISYADSFAAALAKHNQATLITGDREFQQLQKEIEIAWL